MQGNTVNNEQIERVPMRGAIAEITDRLLTVRHNLNDLRAACLTEGDIKGSDCANTPANCNLESKIFDLYPIISDIEHSVLRLCGRVGLDATNSSSPNMATKVTSVTSR